MIIETISVSSRAANLWGLTLTPADVNASDFGVVFSVQEADGSGEGFHVDYISTRFTTRLSEKTTLMREAVENVLA